jgi:DNA-binding transcriptional regulator PaaX
VEATAEEVGLPATVVRDALHKAREKGVLTRTHQGRAGGELTPRAKALLRQAPREMPTKKKGDR